MTQSEIARYRMQHPEPESVAAVRRMAEGIRASDEPSTVTLDAAKYRALVKAADDMLWAVEDRISVNDGWIVNLRAALAALEE
jgi:major membrane immunogen (membrane-anchored lipoprotein)